MKAVLRELHSPDIHDLANYVPEDSECFGFLLQLFIGPEDDMGSESFDVVVCTPKWLTTHHHENEIIMGRHRFIVFKYDYQRLVRFITEFLETCTGESWSEVALKVSRLGHWEFEDYQEK